MTLKKSFLKKVAFLIPGHKKRVLKAKKLRNSLYKKRAAVTAGVATVAAGGYLASRRSKRKNSRR